MGMFELCQVLLGVFRVPFTLEGPVFVLGHIRILTLISHKFLETWKLV